jgi:Methyltransferase domain
MKKVKKDLRSYRIHNETYEKERDFYSKNAIIERTEKTRDFERTGFGLALALTKILPKTHIDIGCGVGWLIRKMHPHFEHSVGIEPSEAALLSAKELMKDAPSVHFLNCDMVDGINQLNLKEPAFFTTGAVLSHIENYYVEEFLKVLNEVPTGSVLYFSENYDRNMNWDMWHIRSKEWWRKRLSKWQLIFLDIEVGGYPSGVYGIKVDDPDKVTNNERGLLWGMYWIFDALINITNRTLKKGRRVLLLKK